MQMVEEELQNIPDGINQDQEYDSDFSRPPVDYEEPVIHPSTINRAAQLARLLRNYQLRVLQRRAMNEAQSADEDDNDSRPTRWSR